MIVQIFDQIGLGQWFRYLTAAVEIAGAVALLWPGLAALGAAWLGVTMTVAALTHIFVLNTSPAAAAALSLLCAIVLLLRREQIPALLASFRFKSTAKGGQP